MSLFVVLAVLFAFVLPPFLRRRIRLTYSNRRKAYYRGLIRRYYCVAGVCAAIATVMWLFRIRF